MTEKNRLANKKPGGPSFAGSSQRVGYSRHARTALTPEAKHTTSRQSFPSQPAQSKFCDNLNVIYQFNRLRPLLDPSRTVACLLPLAAITLAQSPHPAGLRLPRLRPAAKVGQGLHGHPRRQTRRRAPQNPHPPPPTGPAPPKTTPPPSTSPTSSKPPASTPTSSPTKFSSPSPSKSRSRPSTPTAKS